MATDEAVLWTSVPEAGKGRYIALFNLTTKPLPIRKQWQDLKISATKHRVRDLWQRRDLGEMQAVERTLPPHGSVLYKVSTD
jgi:hypothetical protein